VIASRRAATMACTLLAIGASG
jgi:hypothetical protein